MLAILTATLCTAVSTLAAATVDDPIDTVDPVEATEHVPHDWYGDAYPTADRLFDQLTARTLRPNTLSTIINHRNNEGIIQFPFQHLLGFDAGVLKVGLGLRYGILDRWDAALYRLNATIEPYNIWEFDTRYQILQQTTGSVDVAVRAGLTWFEGLSARADTVPPVGGFLAVTATRLFVDRVLINLALQMHTYATGPNKHLSGKNYGPSAALLVGVEGRILEWLAWDAEVSTSFTGFRNNYPIIVTGPRFYTNRHTFSVVVSNSQYSSADSVVANTDRIAADQWVLGFNITRVLDF